MGYTSSKKPGLPEEGGSIRTLGTIKASQGGLLGQDGPISVFWIRHKRHMVGRQTQVQRSREHAHRLSTCWCILETEVISLLAQALVSPACGNVQNARGSLMSCGKQECALLSYELISLPWQVRRKFQAQ